VLDTGALRADVELLLLDILRVGTDVKPPLLVIQQSVDDVEPQLLGVVRILLDMLSLLLDIHILLLDIHIAVNELEPEEPDVPFYSARQLAKATGATVHQIGHWVRRGFLPRTTPRGPYTAYTEEHRLRLLAFLALRVQGLDLTAAHREVSLASEARIRELAGEPLPEPPAPVVPVTAAPAPPSPAPFESPARADAQPESAASSPAIAVEPEPPPALGAYRAHAARGRALWESIAICPGVFVIVRSDADTEARRVAEEIQRAYAAQPG
jgi:hypothetical protein